MLNDCILIGQTLRVAGSYRLASKAYIVCFAQTEVRTVALSPIRRKPRLNDQYEIMKYR